VTGLVADGALLLTAGLLRLTGDPGAADLLVAASVIAVRQLVAVGLRTGDRSLTAGGHGG